MSVNPVVDRRTKHIEIRYHFIREFVEMGHAEVYYVATTDQLADALTKNVPLSILGHFSEGVGLVSSSS